MNPSLQRSPGWQVRHTLGSFWQAMHHHFIPAEGLPRFTPEQIDTVIDELQNRYIPALEALRERWHPAYQPREKPILGIGTYLESQTPMSDALEILGLITESKEGESGKELW